MMRAAVERGHVSIDLVTARFPRKVQNVMQRVTSFVGFAVWGAMAIQLLQTAMRDQGITDTLFIHTWPFKLTFALATFLFSLVLLVQTMEAEHETKGGIQE